MSEGDHTMASAPPDETWTVGEAARYLNGGGVNFGITPKRVRMMAKDPECLVRDVSGGGRQWRRLLASTVRAERRRLLTAAGREDPDMPAEPSVTP